MVPREENWENVCVIKEDEIIVEKVGLNVSSVDKIGADVCELLAVVKMFKVDFCVFSLFVEKIGYLRPKHRLL